MSFLKTNIFSIDNLNDLNSHYDEFSIRGLNRASEDYEKNLNIIIKNLSYKLQTSVLSIERDGTIFLIAPSGTQVPESFDSVGTTVYFEPTGQEIKLDYFDPDSQNRKICERFLNSAIQNSLAFQRRLWQPARGKPFYSKRFIRKVRNVCIFPGFSIRVVPLPDNKGFGVALDYTPKYVSFNSLPTHLSSNDFPKYKKRCIYHFGDTWYEIAPLDISDLKLDEVRFNKEEGSTSLIEAIKNQCNGTPPIEVQNLDPKGSVLFFKNNRGETRQAPVSLCYPIIDTGDENASRLHQNSIMKPATRYKEIENFKKKVAQAIKMDGVKLKLSQTEIEIPMTTFAPPDLLFGNETVLSARNTDGAIQTSIQKLGNNRISLLKNKTAGFYATNPLERQYIVIPKSVNKSTGEAFISDLKSVLTDLYPGTGEFKPIIIEWNDGGSRNMFQQSQEILKAVDEMKRETGYALVMLWRMRDAKKEEQLASILLRNLSEKGLAANIIHTDAIRECYQKITKNGEKTYVPSKGKAGKLRGYIQNVAINKILLPQQLWPFVLETPLFADLTIGIDVKSGFAGFTIANRSGNQIRIENHVITQSEKIQKKEMLRSIIDLIKLEIDSNENPISTIVIHRDGRFFQSEKEGIHLALDRLKSENLLPKDCAASLLEISKTSFLPIRLFRVSKEKITNPQVGDYFILSKEIGYICTTGSPFLSQGSAQPLRVNHISGDLSFKNLLRDVYFLSNLTWTKPDSCSRVPITIKLTDLRLREFFAEQKGIHQNELDYELEEAI